MNQHNMITRSKNNIESTLASNELDGQVDKEIDSEIDGYGNIKGFIDYDTEEDPAAMEELRKLLNNESPTKKNKYKMKAKKGSKKSKKSKAKTDKMNGLFMNYLILKATEKANVKIKKKNKIKIIEEEYDSSDTSSDFMEVLSPEGDISLEEDSPLSEDTLSEKSNGSKETEETEESEEEEESNESEESNDEGEGEEEEYSFEYDVLDEELEEVLDNHCMSNTEERDMEYFHNLEQDKKKQLIQDTKTIYEINDSKIPLRFKIIESDMDLKTKAIAIESIDKLAEMDISTGEHSKMDNWINGLIKIPFGKYQSLPVKPESTIEDKREFIRDTYKTLDRAIYGHAEAKTHILQVIGKWIKNPESGGNVLAIQGPMGNGKTTLVKDGISKVMNKPFAFVALGGASDSAYFDGHSYTYEGSHWGRIVQILQDSKCMNPIIYFDELDKISDTQKGEEIVHMLTHLTDPSQNSLFQDNYFPGINLDLSKALFIFSYNDESRVNKILKDRMYVINTKGFKTEDKLKISKEYLLPELLTTFNFEKEEIIFSDEILKEIIEKYTLGEEGVRNLKRAIETIISKVNIYMLSYLEGDNDSVKDLVFKIKDFKLPLTLTGEHIQTLLKIGHPDKAPEHMYM